MTKLKCRIIIAWLLCMPLTVIAVTPQISAGVASTAMLKQDGTVWGVGNISGYWPGALQPARLFSSISDAVSISSAGADYALRTNGELWASGGYEALAGSVGVGTDPERIERTLAQVKTKTQVFAGDGG